MYRPGYADLMVVGLVIAPFGAKAETLTLEVGFAAGGTSSTAARAVALCVQEPGVTVVVENKPGASGEIAAKYVQQRAGSSDTLLFMSATSALRVPPNWGLVPVGVVATFDYVAIVRKDNVRTLDEYLRAARDHDELRNVGTAGAGSVAHLIGTELFDDAHVVMQHIPFQTSAQAVQSVLGGHIAMAIVPVPDLPGSDDIRVIARTGDGISLSGWMGIFAPPGTSPQEVDRLAILFRAATDRSKSALEKAGFKPQWQPAKDLGELHAGDYQRLLPIAKKLGVEP